METFDHDINGILHHITEHRPSLNWYHQGIYSDGTTRLIQIAFFDTQPRQRKIGAIVYEADTGYVKNFFYKGLSRKKADKTLTDLLLEILNLERADGSR